MAEGVSSRGSAGGGNSQAGASPQALKASRSAKHGTWLFDAITQRNLELLKSQLNRMPEDDRNGWLSGTCLFSTGAIEHKTLEQVCKEEGFAAGADYVTAQALLCLTKPAAAKKPPARTSGRTRKSPFGLDSLSHDLERMREPR